MSANGQLPKGPTGERGTASMSGTIALPSLPSWNVYTDFAEHVPELRWPSDILVYERMLTHPQVWAMFFGMVLPVMEYDYAIEAGDADADLTAALAADLGLPVGLPEPGEMAPKMEPGLFRFDFLEHLYEAMLALVYGHYYFEQVGVYSDDDGLWHLQKLGPRAPQTIATIYLQPTGGLRGITQNVLNITVNGPQLLATQPEIPVERLVGYIWLPDARRRWVGRSMLRACYEPWLINGRLVRVDAINHERAGGVPTVTTDQTWEGGNLQELQQMASAFRVGENSGGALPPGAKMELLRASGSDVVASMRYHDERIARAWGEMVRQLATTSSGSRALGGTFQDLEAVVRRAVVRWFAGTFREHVIEDWWTYNVPTVNGKLPTAPTLTWRPRDEGVESGSVVLPTALVDPTAPKQVAPQQKPGGAPNPPVARSPRAAGRAPAAAASLPARELRRQPYAQELRAAVDFAALDVHYEAGIAAVDALLEHDWLPGLIAAAHQGVEFTKAGNERKRLTRADMAKLRVPAPTADTLAAVLVDAARAAAIEASLEVTRQGGAALALSEAELAALVSDQALAVAQQTADGISLAASRRAVQLVGGGQSPADVAAGVRDYLHGLEHKWERDQLAGAVQAATNAARLEVFSRLPAEQPNEFYASELLDVHTCGFCRAVDGRQYASIVHAQRDYPTGGYVECAGGPRCRGTVIAVLPESEPPLNLPSHLGPG